MTTGIPYGTMSVVVGYTTRKGHTVDTRVTVLAADNGATLEVATVTIGGHEYTNSGAEIDIAGGHVACYLQPNERKSGGGQLTTWQGDVIGNYWTTGTWRMYGAQLGPYRMRAIRAQLHDDTGREWIGRLNDDWSQLVFLRPAKGR